MALKDTTLNSEFSEKDPFIHGMLQEIFQHTYPIATYKLHTHRGTLQNLVIPPKWVGLYYNAGVINYPGKTHLFFADRMQLSDSGADKRLTVRQYQDGHRFSVSVANIPSDIADVSSNTDLSLADRIGFIYNDGSRQWEIDTDSEHTNVDLSTVSPDQLLPFVMLSSGADEIFRYNTQGKRL